MSQAQIELVGEDVFCSVTDGEELRLGYATAESRLKDWAARYDKAAVADLAAIGGTGAPLDLGSLVRTDDNRKVVNAVPWSFERMRAAGEAVAALLLEKLHRRCES